MTTTSIEERSALYAELTEEFGEATTVPSENTINPTDITWSELDASDISKYPILPSRLRDRVEDMKNNC